MELKLIVVFWAPAPVPADVSFSVTLLKGTSLLPLPAAPGCAAAPNPVLDPPKVPKAELVVPKAGEEPNREGVVVVLPKAEVAPNAFVLLLNGDAPKVLPKGAAAVAPKPGALAAAAPKAGVEEGAKAVPVVAPKAGVLAPKAGLVAAPKDGVLANPKAGVDAAPNAGVVAPKAVVVPPKVDVEPNEVPKDVVAPKVLGRGAPNVLPKLGAAAAAPNPAEPPNAGVELAPKADVEAAPKAGGEVVAPKAGAAVAPNVGVGAAGAPKVDCVVDPKRLVVAPKGEGCCCCPNGDAVAPKGLAGVAAAPKGDCCG